MKGGDGSGAQQGRIVIIFFSPVAYLDFFSPWRYRVTNIERFETSSTTTTIAALYNLAPERAFLFYSPCVRKVGRVGFVGQTDSPSLQS